ncbi:hypothetical protein J8J40_28280, partial [Mycobacterium tuberculosis]|nr:hypothetical protein [Mycobacterium tuberculosis]
MEWRRAMAGDQPVSITFGFDHPANGRRALELFANHRITHRGGRLFHGYVHDVTERRRNEAALHEIRRTHRDVFDNS